MLKWWWMAAFLACDVLVGVALVYVLLQRDYTAGGSVEWALARQRRRRWTLGVIAAALAYFSLAPGFLMALIRLFQEDAARRGFRRRR